jgi:forkhead box protein N
VRHNLSMNKSFEKFEKPGNGARKGCLWALNPAKIHKIDEEVEKLSKKNPMSIRRAMSDPG